MTRIPIVTLSRSQTAALAAKRPAVACDDLESVIPREENKFFDMREVIARLVDADSFFELKKLFDSIPHKDFVEKNITLPDGRVVSLGRGILDSAHKWLTAYKMQLFLFEKGAGNEKIGTWNCWRGKDKVAPSLIESRYTSGADANAASRILLAGKEGTVGLMPPLGGALNEGDPDDGAVGNRDARYAIGAIGMWPADDPDGDAHREWIRDAWARFRAYSTGGSYINFQTGDEGGERVRATYGANFARLAELKRRCDPAGMFRALPGT